MFVYIKLFLYHLVAYRVYNYSIFAATSVGEGPSANGDFLTREDSELFDTFDNVYLLHHLSSVCS